MFARAFRADDIFAWSSGVVYIVYDAVLLMIVAGLTWPMLKSFRKTDSPTMADAARPTLGVLIAAYNEATQTATVCIVDKPMFVPESMVWSIIDTTLQKPKV